MGTNLMGTHSRDNLTSFSRQKTKVDPFPSGVGDLLICGLVSSLPYYKFCGPRAQDALESIS